MADVLQDAETTEFLRERWAKATAYHRLEIIQSIEDFACENSVALDAEDSGVNLTDMTDSVRELVNETESLASTAKSLLSELRAFRNL